MIGSYIEEGRRRLLERNIQKIRGTETGTGNRQSRKAVLQLEWIYLFFTVHRSEKNLLLIKLYHQKRKKN